jgi:hypothetical protein
MELEITISMEDWRDFIFGTPHQSGRQSRYCDPSGVVLFTTGAGTIEIAMFILDRRVCGLIE